MSAACIPGGPPGGHRPQHPRRRSSGGPLLALLLGLPLPAPWAAAQPLRPEPSSLPLTQPLQPTWESMLFAQLEAGDRRRLPRMERLPDGRLRVHYLRRAGEPLLSIPELQALMRNPPGWEREKRTIRALLSQLQDLGVRLEIAGTRRPAAAGEWEPRAAVVRIRPDVPLQGSQEFARVLNHEAIHVAQSCRAGGLRRHPLPLGIQRPLTPVDQRMLSQPIYASLPPAVRQLEQEAFGLQRDLTAGLTLLARHCTPAGRLGA